MQLSVGSKGWASSTSEADPDSAECQLCVQTEPGWLLWWDRGPLELPSLLSLSGLAVQHRAVLELHPCNKIRYRMIFFLLEVKLKVISVTSLSCAVVNHWSIKGYLSNLLYIYIYI